VLGMIGRPSDVGVCMFRQIIGVLSVTMHASELVQADRCTVFLIDEAKDQLWSVTSDSGKEIRILGACGEGEGRPGSLLLNIGAIVIPVGPRLSLRAGPVPNFL